ncbi:MAG: hypothetical protein AAF438_01020 [Pseudomonadota bacterium]
MLRASIVFLFFANPIVALAEMHVVIVKGLGGSETYESQFTEQVVAITTASRSVTDSEHVTTLVENQARKEHIVEHLNVLAEQLDSSDQLVIYLIGHGSYDGYEYKFNVPGPDITGEQLHALLQEIPATKFLVNTSSASGAIERLFESDDTTMVLATRSGVERHATRFGQFFAESLSSENADIDKNRRISGQEAFSFADRQVKQYFEQNNSLATEHAVLRAKGFESVTLSMLDQTQAAASSSVRSALEQQKDSLNKDIESLKTNRSSYDESEYQRLLLQKLIELARVEEKIEQGVTE